MVLLAGDFNFNSDIVVWVVSDVGNYADAREGNTNLKEGFGLLHDLCNEYNLDQVLDKPTRKDSTLDLL